MTKSSTKAAFAATVLLLHRAATFSHAFHSLRLQQSSSSITTLLMGNKRKSQQKLSYAERLQLLREPPDDEQQQPIAPLAIEDGSPQQLAQIMVEAQRRSIDTLTFVRQRVESLPTPTIQKSLMNDGYVVVDNFLASEDAVSKIASECLALFEQNMMETDMTKLGSGEYVVALKGGDEQHALCPRTIETVVSITKQLSSSLSEFNLDGSTCMAYVRIYDRRARMASMVLLNGEDLVLQSFGIVAKEANDQRKVTLLYYPMENESAGGGVTIERENRLVPAKSDRLILLLSDSCRYRPEYFEGSDRGEHVSCLELHLLGKAATVD
jgi:hypothetical protein